MTETEPEFDAASACCLCCGGGIDHWSTKSRGGRSYRYDRCRACDFAFVNPRPTKAWLDGFYAGQSGTQEVDGAERYASVADIPDPGHWPTTTTSQALAVNPNGRFLLDVGAGSGAYSAAAARAGLIVTALEPDPVDGAQLQRLPNVTTVPVSFEVFDAPTTSFDFVLMSHVLEHAHDPKAWVHKAAGLLKVNGVLLISLPHFNSIYRLLGGTMDPYFFPPEHLNHFNRSSLGRLLELCGLNPRQFWTIGEFPKDVITRRVAMPAPAAAVVRGLTACVGRLIECTTRMTRTGPVLSMLAVKRP